MTTSAAVATHRWTTAEYERSVEGGVFHPEARLELIDGEIYDMSPQTSWHATAIRLVEDALRGILGRGFDVRVQLPAALDANSEPEPDVAVVRGGPRDFAERHPSTAALIVEVADSSLAYDRTRKLASYARNGIAEYWIVNLVDGRLEVYREPETETYRVSLRLDVSEEIAPLLCSDRKIAVRDLLP